jgi:hypothetical protein
MNTCFYQALISLFVLLCFLSLPGYNQTFGPPKPVVNPFNGTGGNVGTLCAGINELQIPCCSIVACFFYFQQL